MKLRNLSKSVALFFTLFCLSQSGFAADWKPVTPEDLALTKGRVDPQADAEVLLWDLTVADAAVNNEYPQTAYRYYVRMKVFTDRGVQNFKVPDIEYSKGSFVGQVAGRTIQPDGSIQDVSKDAIIDHLLAKRKGVKDRAVSLAMPNVKPGTLIEYQWRETHGDQLADNVFLEAGREIPVERIVYHVKPLSSPYFPYSMRYLPFNVQLPPFTPDGRTGFFTSSLTNLPGYAEESDALPQLDVLPWVLIYYEEDRKQTPDDYWKSVGKSSYNFYKERIKVNGDVRSIAEEVTSGAKSDEDRVRLLYQYCQKRIRNASAHDVSDADLPKKKEIRTSIDTLKEGVGYRMDIQYAFAALVQAAGFDVRPALLADREFKLFDKSFMHRYLLPGFAVAVKLGDKWKLYDVTTRYLQPGTLRWQEEGVPALITDSKNSEFISTPITDSQQTQMLRKGKLKLDENGGAEGDFTETLTGHVADEWRSENMDVSAGQRENRFREHLTARFGGAEVNKIVLPDPSDLTKPITIAFHFKTDGYSTRTGKRLIFSPAFFEMNKPARYTSATRRGALYYHYGWSESEDVTFETPEGFELDHADKPAPIKIEPFITYAVNISYNKTSITYHRDLTACSKLLLSLPKEKYPAVKQIFDVLHNSDGHLLTLKMQPAAVPVAALH